MSRSFKFISIMFGLVVVSLGVAYYYDHVTRKESEIDRRDWITKSKTYRAAFYPTNGVEYPDRYVFVVNAPQTNDMRNIETYKPIIVTNTFDVRGTNELRMMLLMTEALATLGIEKDESTVRQLVLVRVKADWSTTPKHFREVPDWAPNQAYALKRKISHFLNKGTNYIVMPDGKKKEEEIPADPLTIQRVLECPIGAEIPPMVDYEVRKDVWEEIEAGKK